MDTTLFHVGAVFDAELRVTAALMARFGDLSGDVNPMHVDADYARAAGFAGPLAYGNLLGMLVSYVVGMKLPSKAVLIVRQNLDFRSPVYLEDIVSLTATLASVHESVGTINLDLRFTAADRRVATGTCVVKCL